MSGINCRYLYSATDCAARVPNVSIQNPIVGHVGKRPSRVFERERGHILSDILYSESLTERYRDR